MLPHFHQYVYKVRPNNVVLLPISHRVRDQFRNKFARLLFRYDEPERVVQSWEHISESVPQERCPILIEDLLPDPAEFALLVRQCVHVDAESTATDNVGGKSRC